MTSIFTLIAFIAGFILACILLTLKKAFAKLNRESEIEFLQFERNHRELIRDSKVHRERIAKRSIFSALLVLGVLMAFTLLVPTLGYHESMHLVLVEDFSKVSLWKYFFMSPVLKAALWLIYIIYVFVLWRRYANMNAHQKFLYKIDAKMIKARKKLEGKK